MRILKRIQGNQNLCITQLKRRELCIRSLHQIQACRHESQTKVNFHDSVLFNTSSI